MREKVRQMREQLTTSLADHFNREIEHSLDKVRETFSPYARFVRAEEKRYRSTMEKLEIFQSRLLNLEQKVENLGK